MEINWKSETVKIDKYEFEIKKIKNVKKVDVALKNINITFLCVQTGLNNWDFFYDDLNAYECLIQLLVYEKRKTSEILKKYANTYNEMHALWDLLVCTTIRTFKLDYLSYAWDLNSTKKMPYLKAFNVEAYKVSSIVNAYNCLVSILPENIETTRRLEEDVKRRKLINEYIDKKNEVSSTLESSDTDYYLLLQGVDLKKELQKITNEISYWENGMNLEVVDQEWCLLRISVLRHKVEIVNRAYEKRLSEKLEDQYGAIEELKTGLLKIINGLDFNDALSFFHQYRNIERELKYSKDADEFKDALKPYDRYIEFYQNAGIFVSNYLNEINKYKSKRVSIPQSKLNAALVYMYNAHTVEEAYELRRQKDYIENRSFGEKGEAEVDYALKWLVGDYIIIERTQSGKYGERAIVLNNKEFIDESQEFDHIVIGKQGIFNIETKNYAGKLIVDINGNWIRVRADGSEIGERNPIQQIRRHEAVLKSIVGDDVPIISILVMANPKMIIEGVENFSIPLLKSDRLEEYISTYKNDKSYTKSEMAAIYEKLEQYRVSK